MAAEPVPMTSYIDIRLSLEKEPDGKFKRFMDISVSVSVCLSVCLFLSLSHTHPTTYTRRTHEVMVCGLVVRTVDTPPAM